MYFIRPVWLTHGGEKKDFEVYSCHVSPDGKRLVTAAGDGYVRIWSTEAILNSRDPDYTGPKQLASMSYHSGTIHTVRFSPNGKYLASGADDKIVCIYTLDPNPPSHTTFGSNEAPPVENWRIFRRLIGHDNDVQDLAWSNDSSVLVSVGLDSKIVVWSGYTFEKLKTISSHQSHVKGITFDPANKYFATASDDRTVKIFQFTPPNASSTAHDQANNFVLEKSISGPCAGSPLTTYFRRCSWSPDGNHVAAANATNGPVSSVAIINRGTWDGDIHLIGHEGPVEVCAFSPRLFTREPPDQANGHSPNHVTVIACAGQDKALSVWVTSNSRPLVITQDLAVKSLSDLAWGPDGKSLYVTSLDGTIVTFVFNEGELGYPADLEENEKTLAKYGGGRKGGGMIEGPSGLLLEEQSKEVELKGVEGRMGELMGDDHAASGINGSSTSTNSILTNGTKAVDKTDNAEATQATTTESSPAPAPSKDAQAASQAAKLEKMKQRITITKDGKKRIAPLLVSNSNNAEASLPRAQLRAATSAGQNAAVDAPQSVLDLSKPVDGLPKGGLAALLLGNKRKLAVLQGDENDLIEKRVANASRNGAVPILENQLQGLVPAQAAPPSTVAQSTPEFIRPAVINPSLAVSQIRLAVPKIRSAISQSYRPPASKDNSATAAQNNGVNAVSVGTQTELVLEVKNSTGPSLTGRFEDREPARVSVSRRGQVIWQDFLNRTVLLVAGGQNFWAAACEDGSITAWSPAGRRLLSTIVLESQPVILENRDSWLLCITAVGLCYIWNMSTLNSPHPPVSLAPILDIATQNLQSHTTKAPAVTSARISSEGRIVVTLTNGDGYAYSPDLFAWQRLSEVWWAVGSQYWNTADSNAVSGTAGASNGTSTAGSDDTPTPVGTGIISYLERQTTTETLIRGRAYFLQRLVKQLLPREGYENFESAVSITHLENRLAAALMLGARAEFQTHLNMYARRLGAEGLKIKVEELLRALLGSVLEPDTSHTKPLPTGDRHWGTEADTLCGWPRRDLLRSVVLILGKHRDLQRLTLPYARLLGLGTDLSASVSGTGDDEMVVS